MPRPKLITPNVMVRFKLLPDLAARVEKHIQDSHLGLRPGNGNQLFWTALAREWASTQVLDLPKIGPVRATPEVLARLQEALK